MTRWDESRLMRRCGVIFWMLVLTAGAALFLYDDVYGPRDNVIYLWPLLVLPLMFIAAVTLATHAVLFVATSMYSRLKALIGAFS